MKNVRRLSVLSLDTYKNDKDPNTQPLSFHIRYFGNWPLLLDVTLAFPAYNINQTKNIVYSFLLYNGPK